MGIEIHNLLVKIQCQQSPNLLIDSHYTSIWSHNVGKCHFNKKIWTEPLNLEDDRPTDTTDEWKGAQQVGAHTTLQQ